MNDVLIFAISVAATVAGLSGSWVAYRRRGAASGLRGAAWSMVPMGAYLTGLTTFLADLALSPVKWTGMALLGLGAVLYVTSGLMLRHGAAGVLKKRGSAPAGPAASAGPAAKGALDRRGPSLDPDLAEIEQILKNRGIG